MKREKILKKGISLDFIKKEKADEIAPSELLKLIIKCLDKKILSLYKCSPNRITLWMKAYRIFRIFIVSYLRITNTKKKIQMH